MWEEIRVIRAIRVQKILGMREIRVVRVQKNLGGVMPKSKGVTA